MFNRDSFTPCPTCGAALRVDAFAALLRPVDTGTSGEKISIEGESGCFYHPAKKAVVHCDSCGRFLCGLCDMPLQDRHLCPSCLESGQKKGKIVNLQNRRICYDRLALMVAAFPILVWPFTLLTAPVALFLAIRHWKTPSSITGSSRLRLVTAIALATAQIAGWTLLFYSLATR